MLWKLFKGGNYSSIYFLLLSLQTNYIKCFLFIYIPGWNCCRIWKGCATRFRSSGLDSISKGNPLGSRSQRHLRGWLPASAGLRTDYSPIWQGTKCQILAWTLWISCGREARKRSNWYVLNSFSKFSFRFVNPNYFSNLILICSNLWNIQ